MSDIFKKKIFILLFVVGIGAISIINYKLQNESTLEASSELVAYEEKQLQEMNRSIIVGGREVSEENINQDCENIETATETNSDDYFAESKAVISMDRNKIISMLTEIIENRDVDLQSKDKAVEQKLKIIEYMNQERIVENLLKNKGYKDVLILITDNSVNVSVKTEVLNKSDIAKIVDVVTRETKRPFEDIIIQNKH